MGSIYKPTGRNGKECRVYWAKWYQNGRAIRESTGTDKKGEAVRFLALREGAKAHGITLPPRADRALFILAPGLAVKASFYSYPGETFVGVL